MSRKVLLAEDDYDFAMILKQYIELHDFEIIWARDGEEALELFQKGVYSICIFDVMMPKIDGFTLAEKIIKINPEVPFVFLTAKKLKEDKLIGLKLGADDYIVKPFEADELVLRLNNILKRSEKSTSFAAAEIAIGKYTFNPQRLELVLDDQLQRLTEKEVALVLFLYNNKNRVLKREAILKAVWGTDDFFSGRSMDVFISRLRKYFKNDDQIEIKSIRHIGLEFRL
ncbi:response regulator transcription factor [Flavobacterium kingsejongi]|uniref:DNA-binding response regulator n=1 Tax=Flavobacterium kingsejongi TaxID=1678728 RepID=A0A2S1LT90_9FLAO|nr:response regulator transcription factor [Flavobacterium kingsejongi]AWG26970.1 DNA-binding response regulator [Flavobacterium kingsejongi]